VQFPLELRACSLLVSMPGTIFNNFLGASAGGRGQLFWRQLRCMSLCHMSTFFGFQRFGSLGTYARKKELNRIAASGSDGC
jgi:hypothetical protein